MPKPLYSGTSAQRAMQAEPVSGDATTLTTPPFTPSAGDLWHSPKVFG